MSSSPTYIFENGLRKVAPYYQTCKTHIKTRWEGRTITDVFTNELGQKAELVKNEIESQKIYILENFGRKTQGLFIKGETLHDRLISKHDVIYSIRHMHEPSVIIDDSIKPNTADTGINIVFRDSDFLVVNKPAGIPVHPKLTYKYNSLSEVLKHDLKLDNIWTIHRLDKVTSGLLIFGLNKAASTRLLKIIEHKLDRTKKTYFARVKGYFPDAYTYTCPIFLVNPNGYFMPSNISKLPAQSTTVFKRLRYNDTLDESIVECTPISGKMHQIRIHLRNIGYPISNDWGYNNLAPLTEVSQMKNDIEMSLYAKIFEKYPDINEVKHIDLEEIMGQNPDIEYKLSQIKTLATKRLEGYQNDTCSECGHPIFEVERDRAKAFIYLHAYKYEYESEDGEDSFCFSTPEPDWCNI